MWASRDSASGEVTVGIDVLGVQSLGDLAFVSLLPVGTRVERARPLGALEAAKITGDVVAPVSGEIVAVNADVLRDPSIVNRDPYGQGWLVRLCADRWVADAESLVSGSRLDAWVASEIRRYRERGWIR